MYFNEEAVYLVYLNKGMEKELLGVFRDFNDAKEYRKEIELEYVEQDKFWNRITIEPHKVF